MSAHKDVVAPEYLCPKCGRRAADCGVAGGEGAARKPMDAMRGYGFTMTTRQCSSATCRKCWTEDMRRRARTAREGDSIMTDETDEHPAFARARALPEPWRSHFPKSTDEVQAWRCVVERRALASRVLAVAVTRIEGTWRAYIDAVAGRDHDAEEGGVLEQGMRLPEDVARLLFPGFVDVPYSR